MKINLPISITSLLLGAATASSSQQQQNLRHREMRGKPVRTVRTTTCDKIPGLNNLNDEQSDRGEEDNPFPNKPCGRFKDNDFLCTYYLEDDYYECECVGITCPEFVEFATTSGDDDPDRPFFATKDGLCGLANYTLQQKNMPRTYWWGCENINN